jgi:hydrogenase-4 component E
MSGINFDIAHLLAGSLVLVSFLELYQDRLYALLNVYAAHALVLAASVAWQAFVQDAPHLYVTAIIALVFKAIVIPVTLHRLIVRLGIHREIEKVVGVGTAMLAGIGLVALSMVVMLRVTQTADPLAREDLAFALAVVLLGLLMMVTRQNAGKRPGAGGDRRQGHAARGRDQRRVFHSHRIHRHRNLPVPHPRTLRHHRRASA